MLCWCGSAQSLPVEIQYLDTALTIRSGTEIRRWTIKEFCPQNGLTVEQLRERVRALYRILEDLLHEEMAVLHDKVGHRHLPRPTPHPLLPLSRRRRQASTLPSFTPHHHLLTPDSGLSDSHHEYPTQ